MSKTIEDLRTHLFDVMEKITASKENGEPVMEADRAEIVCLAAKRLIETAAVELQAVRMMGGNPTSLSFFEPVRQALLPTSAKPAQLAQN